MNETTELIMKQLNQKKVHAVTHELGGGDEVDVTKLKNISNYVTKTGDFAGTWNGLAMTSVDPGLSTSFNNLSTNFNALKADFTQRGINVKSAPYNAKGDGVTDDTAAIQAAINASTGTIFIPSGTYMINAVTNDATNPTTGGITLPSNRELILAESAVLKAITNSSQTYAVIRIPDSSNVRIQGGIIQGERSTHTGSGGEWGNGILIQGGIDVTIENVTIKDCWGDGIYVGSGAALVSAPSKRITIRNVVCDNNRRQGMSITHADGMAVMGSTFKNTIGTAPQHGVDIEPNTGGYYVKNSTFTSCKFEANSGCGIGIDGSGGTVSAIIVEGCQSVGATGSGIKFTNTSKCSAIGNYCDSNGDNGISILNSSHCAITGNQIYTSTNYGIFANSNANYNTLSGNICNSNGQAGIGLISGSSNNVTGNLIRSNTKYGIEIFSSINNIINGNTVLENSDHGIYVNTSSHNTQISNNRMQKNAKDGIRLDTVNDCTLTGNYASENSQLTNNTYNNIRVTTCNDPIISSNTVRQGALTNKPANGISVDNSPRAFLQGNDTYTGGVAATGYVIATSTGSLATRNKKGDGTFDAT